MPHVRRPIAGALILNTSIRVFEALAGLSANNKTIQSRREFLRPEEIEGEHKKENKSISSIIFP